MKEAEIQFDVYESMILYNKDFEPKNDNSNYEHKIEFLKIAIEALEKQVPKKPIKKKMATLNKTPNAFSWESTRCCPRCKSNLVVKIFGKHLEDYCPLCGQRIDWSDAE